MSNLPTPDFWKFHSSLLVEHDERFKYLIHYRPDPFCRLRFTFDETEMNDLLATTDSSEVLIA